MTIVQNSQVPPATSPVPPVQQTPVPSVSQTPVTPIPQSPVAPVAPVSTTMSRDSIATPVTPIAVPQTPVTLPPSSPSVANPQGTTVDSNGNATITPPPAPPVQPEKTAYQQTLDKILGLNNTLGAMSGVTAQLQNETDLAGKTTQATVDYNAYNKAKVELNQRIENMQSTNAEGKFGSDVSGEIARVQREGNANLANLAIQAQASQGLLSAAQQTIKDKLDAQFKPIQDQIDYLTKFASLNQNQLSDKEQIQLQQTIDTKKTENANVQTTSQDIHDRLLQNNAPQSVYSAVDKITSDYTSGKITAQEAQDQMYQATGQYGAKNKYSVVTNPLTGVQSAFDTTTGTFKGQDGQAIPSSDLVTNPKLATETINQTAPIISNGMVTHPPTGNMIVDTAQQLVDGNQAPSQTRKGLQGTAIMTKANELSIAQTGKPYSLVDAEAAYKFRNSGTYQKFIANAPVAMSTINTIVNDVHTLQDSGFDLNGTDLFNSVKLKATAGGWNPFATQQQRATAKELVNTLGSISADDIGLLLGSGSGSDYKTQLGGAIFDVSGNVKTTDQIAKTVNDRIQAKLNDYYKIAGVKDPSIYATRDTQAINGSADVSTTPTSGATLTQDQARNKYGY